jgi:NAD-dependent DNA ligase
MDYYSSECITEVVDVEWYMAHYGKLCPIVHIKSIIINDKIISKVSGFNALFIENNGIGKGAIIKIILKGDVIPYISEVIVPINISQYQTDRCD